MATSGVFYMGQLGRMAPLPGIPRGGVVPQDTLRTAGEQTSLGGRVTTDIVATRRNWGFDWHALTTAERDLIENHLLGFRPGPLRMIDPTRRNRLSVRGSGITTGLLGMDPVLTGSGTWTDQDLVTTTGLGSVRGGLLTPSTTSVLHAHLDRQENRRVPVLLGETLTSTVWVYCPTGGGTVALTASYFNLVGSLISTLTGTTVALAAATWTRVVHTWTVGSSTAVGASPRVSWTPPSAGVGLYVAQPQIEEGAAATAWSSGGGCPEVRLPKFRSTALSPSEFDVVLDVEEV
ncbi:hypothetical protein [Actinomycetospora sp. CA-053990]|uniref:hypothetical protein n=1 Tax=Actinomycetospora sp. CA-053990 TaxID=3239891 RepID=UPI003D8DA023